MLNFIGGIEMISGDYVKRVLHTHAGNAERNVHLETTIPTIPSGNAAFVATFETQVASLLTPVASPRVVRTLVV